MKDPKEQKIVVLTELIDSEKNIILHGIKLAGIFQKELCLFYNFKKGKSNYLHVDEALSGYKAIIRKDIPNLPISTLILDGKLDKLVDRLADDYEAVLVLAPGSLYEKLAKAVRKSSIPFLFIDKKSDTILNYKKVTAPIDLRKENSDVSLWCSYFGRFNRSEIVVAVAKDKEKSNIRQITKNILNMKKLLEKFQVPHKIYKGTKNSFAIQYEALGIAKKNQSELFIMLGSSFVTPVDLLLGLPEEKVLKKCGNLPVMIINPRKDMYILCD